MNRADTITLNLLRERLDRLEQGQRLLADRVQALTNSLNPKEPPRVPEPSHASEYVPDRL